MNEQHTTAKDFFIHLGALITLYVSVISLISLLFAIINQVFPDALYSYGYYGSGESYTIRWTISSLVILFPLYIYLARTITKDIALNPIKKDFWIRKWSKYLTLFLTGGAVIVDLIVLINTFLGGEISARFFLKVIVVLVVAAFTFYVYVKENHKSINLLIGIASAVVLASVVGGFLTVGSPAKQRALEFDRQRVNDLQSLKYEVENYTQRNKMIPESLQDVASANTYISIKDPETKLPYEYAILPDGKFSYRLCANFATVSKDTFWAHDIGRTCFDLPLGATQ